MEEYEKSLQEAMKNLQIADHMTYLTYPLINEKRILLKIFNEIFKAVKNCIRATLYYEASLNKIEVFKDENTNLHNFVTKISKKYDFSEKQLNLVLEIYELNKIHEDSPMEFVKKDKMVIMSDNLGLRTLDIAKIKEYLIFSKEFLGKVNTKLKNK
jgi:hypothetical protein